MQMNEKQTLLAGAAALDWVMVPSLGTRHAVSSALYSPFAGKRKFWYSPALPANSTSPAAF